MEIVEVGGLGRFRDGPASLRVGVFQMEFHAAQQLLRFHLFHPHVEIFIFGH